MISTPATTQVLMLCTAILYVKYLAALMVQGGKKFTAGTRAPEDMAASSAIPRQNFGLSTNVVDSDAYQQAKADDIRWQRIVGNDLENLPFGIILAWTSILAGGNTSVTSVAYIIFTIVRVVHTLAFANHIFWPRTSAWTLGILSMLTMAINGIVGSFS
ncbi:hypothetical protein SDRG_05234 [Saprolegnia diclina VS20]|uniref:Microsomal glutathione S-transferase 1 n=1 Tax=Saprolegnia diclina (strain VS20) TaxID=1156394 RepID=T0S4J3_SAPDV|nr:hypothetical protein SDRG_05234 [Saprolegnia diclina VS20]EQC37642.1 hypothetical protein SDRG_05234 [Saprolegnia diclina VS20]|eukprot:XP_008609162.1 hypothetical protein SDRG_05234 [Saprolegnia diclina VS20]